MLKMTEAHFVSMKPIAATGCKWEANYPKIFIFLPTKIRMCEDVS